MTERITAADLAVIRHDAEGEAGLMALRVRYLVAEVRRLRGLIERAERIIDVGIGPEDTAASIAARPIRAEAEAIRKETKAIK